MTTSPDGRFSAELLHEGEIHWGPEYYRLRINGREIPNRLFGSPLTWSDDSVLLAAQEWLTTDYKKGPVTRVVLINVECRQIAPLEVVDKGFAESFRFVGLRFVYRKNYLDRGEEEAAEIELSAVHNWSDIDSRRAKLSLGKGKVE